MKALWTYWNRFVFYHSLAKRFCTWWVFSFFYFCFCFPVTLGVFKQQPPTHCYISHKGERVFDQPAKVGISLVRKCSLPPTRRITDWKAVSIPRSQWKTGLGWDHEGLAMSLNSLAGTGLNCTSNWIFPCESSCYMGHIFYHNFCNYLKYHVYLLSLLQPINVYLINVKKKKSVVFAWVYMVKEDNKRTNLKAAWPSSCV